jgi:hypothetical protein
MHRHSRPACLWDHAHDLASLQDALLALPLFDPTHATSLYDLRHGRRRRVPCPQRAALVATLADILATVRHQHTVRTRQAAALQRQVTRLLDALVAWHETLGSGAGRSQRLQQALAALTALQALDLRTLVPAGPPARDTLLLLALYTAFVAYAPPRQRYPYEAIYTSLAVLWQALEQSSASSEPAHQLALLAARLGRRIRRHAVPALGHPSR